MAAKKSEVEMSRATLTKAVRNAVRLKHSIRADAELNEVLPLYLSAFDDAVLRGKKYTLDLAEILGD